MPNAQRLIDQSDLLDEALEFSRANYLQRRPASVSAFDESTRYMPGGNTRTVLFHGPVPLRIESGDGCRIRDADGHNYINLLGEYTAGLFGHNDPVIRVAIDRALDNGVNLSAHNPDEIELARLVCDRFPSIDKVRFTNSGTEANLLAISIARFITGRKKVLVFEGGYHGGLLYFRGGGIAINAPFDYLVADYNDIEATRAL
ncbi:MAG: glutamate-1-semialdehyde 2,1-aminomutase, partial [Gammaproteobacteria bacterium]